MEDERIWAFEESLWKGGSDVYRRGVDPQARMALPAAPFIFSGEQAIEAVENTPRWTEVRFENGSIARPQHGLIVIGYTAHARREGEVYTAHCTSTYLLDDAHEWHVIQHSQTPPLTAEVV